MGQFKALYPAESIQGGVGECPALPQGIRLPLRRHVRRLRLRRTSTATFAIYRDGEFLGGFQTDEFGEILLTNARPGLRWTQGMRADFGHHIVRKLTNTVVPTLPKTGY